MIDHARGGHEKTLLDHQKSSTYHLNMANQSPPPSKQYQSFEEFWPFYLSQHSNDICRGLHLWGTTTALLLSFYFIASTQYSKLFFCPIIAYGCAWIGHFVFEKNRPATFTYPQWSFRGDFLMLQLFYQGKLSEEIKKFGIQRN